MTGFPATVYLCDQAQLTREGNHFVVTDISNGKQVGRRVYTYDAMLKLTDQAVRAVTTPATATIAQLPRRRG